MRTHFAAVSQQSQQSTTIRIFGANVICGSFSCLKTQWRREGKKMYFIFGLNVNIFSFSVVNNNWAAYKLTK